MKYSQVTGTFKVEPLTEDMMYAQVGHGPSLPKGLYFCSASYNIGSDGFKLGNYMVTSKFSRRVNNEVKVGDILITKVGEDTLCDVLPESMFNTLYQPIIEVKPVSTNAYMKLDKLLNDWKVFPPFRRDDTVVCMDIEDLEEMLEYIRHSWGINGDMAIKRLTFKDTPLPKVLGVMVCDKRRHILIDQLNKEYNIVIMPNEPLGCMCYKAKVVKTPCEWPKESGKINDVDSHGAPGQCYYQVVLGKQDVWKLQHELQKLKMAMENNPRGHLNDDDVEMIWDGKTFCLRLFGMGTARFPDQV